MASKILKQRGENSYGLYEAKVRENSYLPRNPS